jgi:hypothetical protein
MHEMKFLIRFHEAMVTHWGDMLNMLLFLAILQAANTRVFFFFWLEYAWRAFTTYSVFAVVYRLQTPQTSNRISIR